ncbi:MAG: pilus assembly protein PilM [Candidatus Rokubacteria bacterium]|nr:pilus assembly protein PilM [Candidatus Rokubacteria bacterium]
MRLSFTRLAVVVLGDRLIAVAVERDRVEAFAVDSDTPAAALRSELAARGLSPRKVALALPRAAVTVKPIDLPAVAGDLREMVKFELDRHLPFPAEEAPFDFLALPADAEALTPGGGRRVLVAAADRRLVERALGIAEEAKLRPLSVTVAAHDLPALVKPRPRQRVVWAHRVGGDADLLLLAGGTPVLSRHVPVRDDGELAQEIRRSLGVARWRACDAVWVSGDSRAPRAPSTSALTELGVPVTEPPWTPRARRRLAALKQSPRGAFELALAVALGPRVRLLDLIPAARKPRRLSRAQLLTLGTLAATILLSLGALVAPGYRDGRRLDAINAEIRRLDPEVRVVDRVLRDLERRRRLLATVESLESSALRPLPVLQELTELIPPDAWLTAVAFDAKGVELTGQANAASALIPVLENSPRLERVEFASPVTRGRDREQFRIRAAWQAAGERATPVAAGTPAGSRGGGTSR